MARPRVVIHPEGARALLRSDGVYLDLKRRAEAIQRLAGVDDFAVGIVRGHNRIHASVITATPEGRELEAKHRTLTAAIDAGR